MVPALLCSHRHIFNSLWIYFSVLCQTSFLCWKMTRVAINIECLKENLTTFSTRVESRWRSYYSKAKSLYPGASKTEHSQRAAAASISWELSSWLSLIWSWCLLWKQNKGPNHIQRITSFFRIASSCLPEIKSFLPHNKPLYWWLLILSAHTVRWKIWEVLGVCHTDRKRNYIVWSMHFTLSGSLSRGEVELH